MVHTEQPSSESQADQWLADHQPEFVESDNGAYGNAEKTIVAGLESVDPNELILSNESKYFSSSKQQNGTT